MAKTRRKFVKGIRLKETNVEAGTGAEDLTLEGEIAVDASDNELKARLGAATRTVVTEDQTQTITNKTIDVDNNTVSNIEVDNLKAGVLNTDLSGAATDAEIPSALAVKNALAGQNDASEIDYDNSTSGLTATDVQAAIDEVEGRLDSNETVAGNNTTALSAHINDAVDAHNASAISNVPAGNLAATDIQAAVNELQTDVDTRALDSDLTAHLNDTVDAHDASAVSYDNVTSGLTATEVQSAIDEVEGRVDTAESNITTVSGDLSAHVGASSGVHGVTGSVVGTTDSQVLTNKDIDGGTASDTSRITLPKNTKTNLDGLTRKEATLVYASDEGKAYVDDGTNLIPVGSGAGGSGDLAPDIEDSTPVVTNVVAVKDEVTFLPIDANTESVKATFSGSDGSIRYQAPISADLDGAQGLISFWAKTSLENLDVYSTVDGVQESQSIRIDSSNKWRQYEIPTVLSNASHGFEILANGAVAGDVFIDDIKVELAPAGYVQNVEVVSAWQSYTPTTQGFGTIASNTLEWRQVGSSVEIRGGFTSGTVTGDEAQLGLPNSYTVKQLGANTQVAGNFKRNLYVTRDESTILSTNADSFLNFGVNEVTPYDSLTPRLGNQVIGSTQRISINASVPVNELSATPQAFISQNASFPVVTGAGSGGEAITANVTDIPFTEIEDARGYWDGDSFTPTRVEDAGYYLVSGSIASTTSITSDISLYVNGVQSKYAGRFDSNFQQIFSAVIYLSNTQSVSVRSGAGFTVSNNSNTHNIHIQKIPDEAYILGIISQNEPVAARYTSDSGQAIANSTSVNVDFNTKTYDTHNAVTTGASWEFTSPLSGLYNVSVAISLANSSSWSAGEDIRLYLYKNGTLYSYLDWYEIEATGTFIVGAQGSDTVELNKGDSIYIDLRQSSGSSINLTASSSFNYISIQRIK